jgi:hypothetical protein
MDLDDLCAALSATRIQFDDIIDSVHPFENAEEAIEKVWQGKVVGKVVLHSELHAQIQPPCWCTKLEVPWLLGQGRNDATS